MGKTVILPLMNREIPIVADEYVEREFGSGAVKITPALTRTILRSVCGTIAGDPRDGG